MTRLTPLMRLTIEQPQLLAEPLAAYADLIRAELEKEGHFLRERLLRQLLVCLGLAVGSILSGVAVLLALVLPDPLPYARMAAVAALPLLLSLAVWLGERGRQRPPMFAALRGQAALDRALIASATAERAK
ncbi:MAG: hypothetical protein ACK5PG_18385 [Lysobacterales bacterium]|jgi:hypothetical protein